MVRGSGYEVLRLVKNKQNGGKANSKEAKNMQEFTYKPQENGRMI